MKRSKELLYAAVDVGTSKVATVVARVAGAGTMEVAALGLAVSEGMHKGLVVNSDDLSEAVRRSVADARAALGARMPPAHVSVTGGHLQCCNASGTIFRTSAKHRPRAFTQADVDELLGSSVPPMPSSRRLVQIVPRRFEIDGCSPVRDPVGICGEQLSAESHVVSADSAALQLLERVMRAAGVRVRRMVLQHLASASAVLSEDERNLGTVVVDIGGGTRDIAVFADGAVCYTTAVPVAGNHFTSDLALGLSVPPSVAEAAKLQHGSTLVHGIEASELLELNGATADGPLTVRRLRLHRILRERAVELVRLILHRLREAGMDRVPPCGIVLTGGGAKLEGLADIAAEAGNCSVRVGSPSAALGLPQELEDPSFSTSVGLLLSAVQNRHYGAVTGSRTATASAMGWLRRRLPNHSPHSTQGVEA